MDLISGMVPNYQQIVCVGDITEDDYTAYPRYLYVMGLVTRKELTLLPIT